jgi:hypothetical protein
VVAELAIVAGLAYTTWGQPAERPALMRIAAAFVASGLVIGAVVAPTTTIVTLAVLHNLTPLGFFADALDRRDLGLAAVALLGVPLVIATGLPAWMLTDASAAGAAFDPLQVGPLADHLGVYVPNALHGRPFTEHLFRAAVYGQWAHYVAVIGVLPALTSPADRASARVPWPPVGLFAAAVVALAVPLFAAFTIAFADARAAYGLLAAVHAWIEVPVLLGVLGGATRAQRSF